MLKCGVFLIILACCSLGLCQSAPNTSPVSQTNTPAVTLANTQPAQPQTSPANTPAPNAEQKKFWSKDGTGNKLTFWGLILTAIGILVSVYLKKNSGNSSVVKIGNNNSGQTIGTIDSKGGPITVNQGDSKLLADKLVEEARKAGKLEREPIGPGLMSIEQITKGSITYENNTLNYQPLIGMIMSITGGSIWRNDLGKLETYIKTVAPFQAIQQLNEKWGLDKMQLLSESNTLSTDPNTPTVFTASTNHILPPGEKILDFTTGQEKSWPMSIQFETHTKASGYVSGKVFQGEFKANLIYYEFKLEIGLQGRFQAILG